MRRLLSRLKQRLLLHLYRRLSTRKGSVDLVSILLLLLLLPFILQMLGSLGFEGFGLDLNTLLVLLLFAAILAALSSRE